MYVVTYSSIVWYAFWRHKLNCALIEEQQSTSSNLQCNNMCVNNKFNLNIILYFVFLYLYGIIVPYVMCKLLQIVYSRELQFYGFILFCTYVHKSNIIADTNKQIYLPLFIYIYINIHTKIDRSTYLPNVYYIAISASIKYYFSCDTIPDFKKKKIVK